LCVQGGQTAFSIKKYREKTFIPIMVIYKVTIVAKLRTRTKKFLDTSVVEMAM